jgi:hypothetical protein
MNTQIDITTIFEFLFREPIVAKDFNKYHTLILLFEYLIKLGCNYSPINNPNSLQFR